MGIYVDRHPVVSSNLKEVGWGQWYGFDVLEIEFRSGSVYVYYFVPLSVFIALMKAPSKGEYFWANIRCKTIDCSGGDVPYSYDRLK